jgi:hypothetical protein
LLRPPSEAACPEALDIAIREDYTEDCAEHYRSEVALQIIQCAISFQLCSALIVSDLYLALISQLAIVRFTIIKLIIDMASQHSIHSSVAQFIQSNAVLQLAAILSDDHIDC